ncbi:MAG: AAA family ATPase [Candidatus Spechtbacteria bacterium]|nr:AAA family ATPase [Candidatus Spechtbacteria bacterium]
MKFVKSKRLLIVAALLLVAGIFFFFGIKSLIPKKDIPRKPETNSAVFYDVFEALVGYKLVAEVWIETKEDYQKLTVMLRDQTSIDMDKEQQWDKELLYWNKLPSWLKEQGAKQRMDLTDSGLSVEVTFPESQAYFVYVPRTDMGFLGWLTANKVTPHTVPKYDWRPIIIWVVPSLLLIAVIAGGTWWMVTRGPLGGAMRGFGKKEKREGIERPKERFSDVAGMEEIIREVNFIVKFFKKPYILKRLGGKPKKGVLLSGPPGVGKTLLARAIAGEANVNFFPITGSEFVEMFVGVGASRIRDLFSTAKKFAPAIIFIDEVDSLGKRQAGLGDSAGQEYRQTLNQLLAEMDGFDSLSGILVIFASNFPELIDPALRRKGRIDSEIKIPLPSLAGRKAILTVHLRNQTKGNVLDTDVDIDKLANKTYNFSGADIANFANEAVFVAAKKEKDKISKVDFDEAFDIIVLGLAGKPVGDLEERGKTAIAEAGHALVARLLPALQKLPIQVASILRRADSMGLVQLIQEGDMRSVTKEELEAQICFCFGHRVAEQIVYGVISSGASTDLGNATRIAHDMVRKYGMSELGPIVVSEETSETTRRDCDMAAMKILAACEKRTEDLLRANERILRGLADALVLKEELRVQEVDDLIRLLQSEAA